MRIPIDNYHSGTSGLLLPVPNKLHYPEPFREKSRLSYYSSLNSSIEINSSFYGIPMGATIRRWSMEVPEGFLFTFKLFREITHGKNLGFDPRTVARFFEAIGFVGDKKGCLLVQFPPSVSISQLVQLGRLMQVLRENDPGRCWRIALEFRHASLYCEKVYEMLGELGMAMVLHDKYPAASPILESGPGFIYLRFHGPGGNYRESYGQELLDEYAGYICQWLGEGRKVFAYFNNTMGGAVSDLNLLRQLVEDKCRGDE